MPATRKRRIPLASLVPGLSWLLCSACATLPDAVPEADAGDPGRAAFETIALPETGNSGPDPLMLARDIYGTREPVEGNYSEIAMTLTASANEQVVLFTRSNLPDDSVRGERYRLEFVPVGGLWTLTRAGRQVTCWPGRGHEDWSTESCH